METGGFSVNHGATGGIIDLVSINCLSGLSMSCGTMKMRAKSSLVLGFSIAFLMSQAFSFGAGFEGLGFLPEGSCSEATAVSADGSVVVGTGCTTHGVRAFRWTASQGIAEIPAPDGMVETWATGVSADGAYVSGYGRAGDSPPYGYAGFRYHISGVMNVIAVTGSDVIAKGISGDGSMIVGTSWSTDADNEAFFWTEDDGLTRLSGLAGQAGRTNAEAISDDGLVIVGDRIYDGAPYRDCFVWTEAGVSGFSAHTVNAVSRDGSLVVGGLDNHDTSLFEAYRWTAETGTLPLGTCLPDYHSRALGVSGDGSIIVGYVQNNAGFDEQKAFIWDQQHGMRLLQNVLEEDYGFDLSGWKMDEQWASWKATAISQNASTIVGTALNEQGRRQAWRAVLRRVVYVDKDAGGANNGSSWADAYNHLQDALMFAPQGAAICVAQGIYRPDEFVLSHRPNLGKEETFKLRNRIAIRGGYAGFGHADPGARDVNEYETILSGDLAENDIDLADAADLLGDSSREDNSYHVVTGHDTNQTAVLDGFTITGGNANHGYWVAYYGGGITADAGRFTLLNCRIEANVAAQGGGLHIGSGGATLSGCTFTGNAAFHAGGMINGAAETTVTDCAFLHNYADTGGGATICTDAAFKRCTFVRNRAAASNGGAVNNDCSGPTFDQCTFIENSAPYAGGAISNYEGHLVITNCGFIANSSDRGGAIYQGDTHSILTGCEFIDNDANTGGGIMNVGYSYPTLTDCNFTGNSAEYGGGFYNTTGSHPTFNRCEFIRNSAARGGGAIASVNNYLFSPALKDCILSRNTAHLGGAIYNDDTNMILTDCSLSRNSAGYEGGGFYNLTGEPVLTGCTFNQNRSDQDGGGMQNDDGTPLIRDCAFIANFAEDEGGGICNEDARIPPMNPKIVNCLFAGNVAGADGGGIGNDTSSPEVINCTFVANKADDGGGMYGKTQSAAGVTNCIFRSNSPDQIYDDKTITTAAYCNIDGGWPGAGNIDADPCFANPGYWDANETPGDSADDFWVNGDYHLKSQSGRWHVDEGRWTTDEVTSLCIDAGDPMGPLGYEPFPNGGIINMGAYGGTTQAGKSYFDGPPCRNIVAGDLNGDCAVDFQDFRLMAMHWMEDSQQ